MKNIIFDFGGVLLGWERENLYEKMFEDKDEMRFFLDNVCDMKWNEQMDLGKPFAKAVQEKIAQYPKYEKYILAYDAGWEDMITGVIKENVEILKQAKDNKIPCYGLSNFSCEKFEITEQKHSFFSLLDGKIVSGYEGVVKPDKKIYELLLKRYGLKAEENVFIDDSIANINKAKELGFGTIHYQGKKTSLKKELGEYGFNLA